MRVIIYAKGQVFEKCKNRILWDEVVAIADKEANHGETVRNVPVIHPKKLENFQYDYIAIFSNKFFEQIKNELIGEYFVSEWKIISWKGIVKGTTFETRRKIAFLENFIKEKNIKKILDARMDIWPQYFLCKDEIAKDALIDGIGVEKHLGYRKIYNRIYPSVEDSRTQKYELTILWDDIADLIKILEIKNSRYVLGFMSYVQFQQYGAENIQKKAEQYGRVYFFTNPDGAIWLVDCKCDRDSKNEMKLYVVTHKKYNMPNDNLYTPFVVGTKYVQHNYLSEMQGENIAYLNEKINECTALYWIWKNTTSKYVGLNHYRRKFYNDGNMNSGNYLDAFHAKEILREYDMILTAVHLVNDDTVKTQLENTLEPEVFSKGYDIVRAKLEKYQPEYVEAFDDAMNLRALFVCNMFVTRREILNEYCEWLFSFLIEAAEEMDVSTLDNYNKRVMGFFAERMWTVWLMKKDLKIKELPITEV